MVFLCPQVRSHPVLVLPASGGRCSLGIFLMSHIGVLPCTTILAEACCPPCSFLDQRSSKQLRLQEYPAQMMFPLRKRAFLHAGVHNPSRMQSTTRTIIQRDVIASSRSILWLQVNLRTDFLSPIERTPTSNHHLYRRNVVLASSSSLPHLFHPPAISTNQKSENSADR